MPMSQAFKEPSFPGAAAVTEPLRHPFPYLRRGRHPGDRQPPEGGLCRDRRASGNITRSRPCPIRESSTIMRSMGFGFDCSSIAELRLSRRVGGRGEDIMYTSNNTSHEEFVEAASERRLHPQPRRHLPRRQGPGHARTHLLSLQSRTHGGSATISSATRSKPNTGSATTRSSTPTARPKPGAPDVSASTPCSPQTSSTIGTWCRPPACFSIWSPRSSAELAITFEFINIGGGLGIPYQPDVAELRSDGHGPGDHRPASRRFERAHGYATGPLSWRAAAI